MAKEKYFKKGSTSYKILVLSIVFAILSVSILSPVFLIEGGNRTLGIILACVLGGAYVLLLLYFIYEWAKGKPSNPSGDNRDAEKNGKK